jgi:WD40 repeat protein
MKNTEENQQDKIIFINKVDTLTEQVNNSVQNINKETKEEVFEQKKKIEKKEENINKKIGTTYGEELGELNKLKEMEKQTELKKEEKNKESESSLNHTWKLKYILMSHLDGVRSLSFHPKELILFSGSEDSTIKMWNLKQYGKK